MAGAGAGPPDWTLVQVPISDRIARYQCPSETADSGINCNALTYYMLGLLSGDAALGYTKAMKLLIEKAEALERAEQEAMQIDEPPEPEGAMDIEDEINLDLSKPKWQTLENKALEALYAYVRTLALGTLDPLSRNDQLSYQEETLPTIVEHLAVGSMCVITFGGSTGSHAVVLARSGTELRIIDPQRGRRLYGGRGDDDFYTSFGAKGNWAPEYFEFRDTLNRDDLTPFLTFLRRQSEHWEFLGPRDTTVTTRALCANGSYTLRGPIPYPATVDAYSKEYLEYRKTHPAMEVDTDLLEFLRMPSTVRTDDTRLRGQQWFSSPDRGFALVHPFPPVESEDVTMTAGRRRRQRKTYRTKTTRSKTRNRRAFIY